MKSIAVGHLRVGSEEDPGGVTAAGHLSLNVAYYTLIENPLILFQ
jgi:hypothetical protein